MKLIKYIIVLIFSHSVSGQLVTSGAMSPSSLVQNVLLGNGVVVSNINYSGSPLAIGSFTATGTNLGLANGIIITTGTIQNNGQGPQGPNNSPSSGIDNNKPGYSLLAAPPIGNNTPTYNAAVLEFDFIPYSDSVKFRYVFGSEEYPEFVGSQFNDVFAFFISGPGIAGQKNMALIPGTNTAVAINNVNNGNPTNGTPSSNSAYYVSNNNGATIQYDGFTTVLEAKSKVQCGQKYHLIIAIADVGDGIYDSGIFLEANSLSSKTPIDITYTISNQSFPDPNTMAEGCTFATVKLERTTNLNTTLTVPINVSGSASEGVDYTSIPNSVTFAPGQSVITFTVDAFADALLEGLEDLIIDFVLTDPCGNLTPIQIKLFIDDTKPLEVEIEQTEIVCPGDIVTLTAIATGGGGGYSYIWSTGETTQSIQVSPASTTNYTVTVNENCLNTSAITAVTVNVPIFTPLVANESADVTETCPYVPTELSVVASGGSAPYTYQWSANPGSNLGTQPTQMVIPPSTTTYTIIITDFCGARDTAVILYTITSPPLILVTTPNPTICPYDSTFISVSPSGGFGSYSYFWPATNETTQGIWVDPLSTTTYEVIVMDECQTFNVKANVTVFVQSPTADFNVHSETFFEDLPVTFENTSQNANTYYWTFGDGSFSTITNPQNIYVDSGSYTITLIAYDNLGCSDTIVKFIDIQEEWYIYIPNAFTPNDDRNNNTFYGKYIGLQEIDFLIYNRWGELIFETSSMTESWDGTTPNGNMAQDGVYTYKLKYLTRSGRDGTITGHVSLLR